MALMGMWLKFARSRASFLTSTSTSSSILCLCKYVPGKTFSTYQRSNGFSRKKQVFILLAAGIGGGFLYSWSKKLENTYLDHEMKELDELIHFAQESQSNKSRTEYSIQLYMKALQRVKTLIESEVKSQRRMNILTTKFVYIIDQLANLFNKTGKLDEAEDYYKQTVQALIHHGTAKDDDAIVEISLKLASIYAQQRRRELAENGFNWCIDTLRQKKHRSQNFDINSAALLGICLESYGKYQMVEGDPTRAVLVFTEALDLSRTVFGPNNEQVALSLNNLAVAHNETGSVEYAKELLNEAIDLAIKVNYVDLWSLHYNLANVLSQNGELDYAKTEFKKAVEFCQDEDTKKRIEAELKDVA
ncbi:tetratricopeptide repeat protein 19, mitochondrial-like [Xenia sp. Carnegie-2017]|uniref:tetratricopeptide repeat protein 19, mitochondrial-like n=1 Tax=Xenia sp. Carnegie-2017 TaxID=2897299 RepID=UPI001F046C12|nr:tetratricopeptide repeat protein 19, mitochondrial-like [Xenia sp. Carnegie-2017]